MGWLTHPGSLTDQLKRYCRSQFRVRVLLQGWMRPTTGESRQLNLRHNLYAFIRCVELTDGLTPLVQARTVIPIPTASGRGRQLTQLGERPLGAFIFSDPHLKRESLELARVPPNNPHYPAIQAPSWGRRSVYRTAGMPLMVSEVFVPGFLDWYAAATPD